MRNWRSAVAGVSGALALSTLAYQHSPFRQGRLAFAQSNDNDNSTGGDWFESVQKEFDRISGNVAGILGLRKGITEPLVDKFLPDLDKTNLFNQHKLTVILDVEGTLVDCSWSRQDGWVITKRPGVDELLRTLAENRCEIVLFSSNPENFVFPVLMNLDKVGAVQHRLFKEHLTWADGRFIKDLNRMNRDLSKVILIDNDENSFFWHPDNAVLIPTWHKEQDDKELLAIKAFLLALVREQVKDVREVIRMLGNQDTAKKWAESRKKKYESKKQQQRKPQNSQK